MHPLVTYLIIPSHFYSAKIIILSIFNCLWIMLHFRFNQGVLPVDVWKVAISRLGERSLLNCRHHILNSLVSLCFRWTQHRVCNASCFLDLEYLECKYFSISVQIVGVHLSVLVLTLSSLWSRLFDKKLSLPTGLCILTIRSFGWQCNKPLERGTVLCFCKVWSRWAALILTASAGGNQPCSVRCFITQRKTIYTIYIWGCVGVHIPLLHTQLYLIFNLSVM